MTPPQEPASTTITDNQRQLERIFAQHDLLADLDAPQRQRLLAQSRQLTLQKGEHLFQQGEPAGHFYVVLSGRIKLYRLSSQGSEHIMGMALAGQSFAEGVAFMDKPRYPVNARAVRSSRVLALERSTFLRLLADSFPICKAMLRRMTGRIQTLLDEIESLTLHTSRERLIFYLLRLCPDNHQSPIDLTLPAAKSEIAGQLSIRPETLSRLLKMLQDEGLIQARDRAIRVPDVEALRLAALQP